MTKRKTIKYGKLPVKEVESKPWEKLCVDLIGPYKIKSNKEKYKDKKGKMKPKDFERHFLTMIDPATSWIEIAPITNKEPFTIAQTAESIWLTRYPWPTELIYDRGKEFMGEFKRMIHEDYPIKGKQITVRNPQANSILERVHQTIGNMFRTFEMQDSDDFQSNIQGVINAIMFAVRATYHTTLQASPMQLVFGRDAIFNIKFEANWNKIQAQKQKRANVNNQQENKSRKDYTYTVGQQVLVKDEQSRKFGKNPYKGIYIVTAVHNNGTLSLTKGAVTQPYNIRNVHPYHTS